MVLNECVTAGLEPYQPNSTKPWNFKRLQHLFLRVGFGIYPADTGQYLINSPDVVVDEIVNMAIDLPLPDPPFWHDWTISDYEDDKEAAYQIFGWAAKWLADMWDYGLRDKMALFWHNHFVTELNVYKCPSYVYAYQNLLQKYALGNFKDFTIEMGKTPAMLVYLNGVQSTKTEPNENYARELLELFTLGRDNGYTQYDITQVARALTGWNGFTEACAPITYVPSLHDDGEKTIFGYTDNYDYGSFHELLFDVRKDEIAEFICTELYTFFIGKEVQSEIIDGLKVTFLDNNFEIAPVVSQLLKSEFFFDDKQFGTQINSPVDFIISHSKRLNYRPNEDQFNGLLYACIGLGQSIYNPPNVSGWPGDENWLNTSLITYRWAVMEAYVNAIYSEDKEQFAEFAREATYSYNDVKLVCQEIVDTLMPWGLPFEEDYAAALEVFKFEIPQNYFDRGLWNTDWDTLADQTALLVKYLGKLPAYQLK